MNKVYLRILIFESQTFQNPCLYMYVIAITEMKYPLRKIQRKKESEEKVMGKSLAEFEAEMAAGKEGKSRYMLRSETAQNANRVQRISRLKKEKGKRSKLLAIKEIAVPFDPRTGTVTEDFGPENKFRTELSATDTALLLKEMASKYPEAKETFMVRSGIQEWDTSDTKTLTETDKEVFAPYIVPRIFTLPVVHINIPVMTKGEYGADYKISVKHDPLTGRVIGDMPLPLKANQFFRAVAYEECAEYDAQIQSGEIVATEKAQKEAKSDIRRKHIAVSEDHPSNYIQLIEIPLNAECEFKDEKCINTATADKIASSAVIAKYSDIQHSVRGIVERYMRGELKRCDRSFDYWEIDMICPVTGEKSGEVGLNTTFEKPTVCVQDYAGNDVFDAAFRSYLENVEDIERMVLASVFVSTYDESVERQLLMALPSVIDLKSKYVTKSVIENHKDFLRLVMGDEAEEIIADVEDEISDKSAGSYDTAKEEKVNKEYNLNEMLGNEEAEIAAPTESEQVEKTGDKNLQLDEGSLDLGNLDLSGLAE